VAQFEHQCIHIYCVNVMNLKSSHINQICLCFYFYCYRLHIYHYRQVKQYETSIRDIFYTPAYVRYDSRIVWSSWESPYRHPLHSCTHGTGPEAGRVLIDYILYLIQQSLIDHNVTQRDSSENVLSLNWENGKTTEKDTSSICCEMSIITLLCKYKLCVD